MWSLLDFFSWHLNSSSLESWNQTSLDSWIFLISSHETWTCWLNLEIILWAFSHHLCHDQNYLNQLDSSSWSLLLHPKVQRSRKKKKEEKRREKEAKTLPNRARNRFLHHSSVVLHSFFIHSSFYIWLVFAFKHLSLIYGPLGVPFYCLCIFISFFDNRRSFSLFKASFDWSFIS